MKKIIIAIDSFKGCLTSHEANLAVREALLSSHNDLQAEGTECIDVSDGGEGFLDAMQPDEKVSCKVRDALMRPTDAAYGIKNGKGIIEVAQAIGLDKIKTEDRRPLQATSYGVGELIAYALSRGCKELIVGLGGSASSDCGLGMLRSLKHAWLLAHGKPLDVPFDVRCLSDIKVTLASDVDNPLYGHDGAAAVFGPQKGATPDDISRLDRRARTFARMAARHLGHDCSSRPGAGAAGGLGYAFMEFMDASKESGAELMLNSVDFDRKLDDASLVVTGEGSADSQTLMGKLPSIVMKHARRRGIPCVLLAGRVADEDRLKEAGFSAVVDINKGLPLDNALEAAVARERLAGSIASMRLP